MTQSLFPLAVIILAGSLAALQAPVNAALGASLGSGVAAATISFGVGFVVLLAIMLSSGEADHLGRIASVNRWLLLGGLLGAFYVWAILWTIPLLGVVTAITAMILGQLVVALLLDAIGPFGLPVHEVSLPRVFGVVLVGTGLILSKI
ncbi:DMT family transporter [Tateyamaria omphalii]|uniref:DMT family transporter n=1 Tax=Tateyamaria omphalii TaxID=299262 RepID=UPI001C993886|nr:DMT family transporter [Tateyamaria omphalii]MBY5933475.1 DMT family transporter [Tateyamaria omphalii]